MNPQNESAVNALLADQTAFLDREYPELLRLGDSDLARICSASRNQERRTIQQFLDRYAAERERGVRQYENLVRGETHDGDV